MGSTADQVPAVAAPTPEIVGNAFVHQYYQILHNQAEHVHRFYQNSSKLGRPDENGTMTITTTMNDINAKILSLNYDEFSAEIKTVDTQESFQGGVLVLVTGYLTGKDNITKNFTQTFFLAPQDKNGYFVLNDTFRYIEPIKDQGGERNVESKIEAPVAPDEDQPIAHENNVSQQISESPVGTIEEVYVSSENGNVPVSEEETPVPEVIDEVDDNTDKFVSEPVTKVEDAPKMSYASILKVAAALPSQSPPPKKPVPRSSEAKVAPPLAVVAEPVVNTKTVDYKNYQEEEVAGHSIYIKSLPLNATPALLEAEFKQYGTIKRNGIQVRSNKDFCFGFVEFEVATAVQKAMEASPITIDGCQVVVEEKRSSSRVNNRSRFPAGRGNGFRSEGVRGGNYGGGRGYGRNDLNNRSEFVNRGNRRGGFSNRGSDGYQRSHSGNGRVNRPVASAFNASARSVAQSVLASASDGADELLGGNSIEVDALRMTASV